MSQALSSLSSLSATLPLAEFIQLSQQRLESALKQSIHSTTAEPGLLEAMGYASLNGGKRVRPVLVYASALALSPAEQFTEHLDSLDQLACAVELIHCYSLVHDDLPAMDDDDLRRGRPTLHKAYDEATAILVGDALQALAFQQITQAGAFSADSRLDMLNTLCKAAGFEGMVAGQAFDYQAVGKQLSLQQLQTMHSLKTGALIQASISLGALSSPKLDSQQFDALSRYGDNIGLAFQVQDDILDVVGDTRTLGKPQGSDREQDKPTYVSLLGLAGAQQKAQQLADAAVAALEGFSAQAEPLRQLARFIVSRKH
ncbi:MAG: geranyl transferase [SAR86 cluster bacterium]|uniref:Geranyl transferase n=1 Tax=SAR86 cluster bacterium TaxID=2030880 RepID=A0A2A4MRJ1_9GAMM|nr:MAG: geranyl transferase [SAR86 cluster bacterium]